MTKIMTYKHKMIQITQITSKLQINCKFDKLAIKQLQPYPKQPFIQKCIFAKASRRKYNVTNN